MFYQLSVYSAIKVVGTVKSLTETKHIFVLTWFALNELMSEGGLQNPKVKINKQKIKRNK